MKTINKIALIGAIGLAAVTTLANNHSGSDTPDTPAPVYTPSPTSYGSSYKGTYRLDSSGGRVANDCYAWAHSSDNPLRATSADISLSITLCQTWPK